MRGCIEGGSLHHLAANDLKMAHEGKDSNEPIRCCKLNQIQLFWLLDLRTVLFTFIMSTIISANELPLVYTRRRLCT